MTTGEVLKSLRVQIENNRILSTSNRWFVPESSLKTILTASAVEKALEELKCEREDRNPLAEAIRTEGIVTFAILIWMRMADTIVEFWRHATLDRSLPLHESDANLRLPEYGTTFARRDQWEFLPHVFRRNTPYQEIDARRILPFIRYREIPEPLGSGGFGTVFREEICATLQQFYEEKDRPVVVVRKRLDNRESLTAYRQRFENEKRLLRCLGSLNHPNIIPLLGSYTYDGEHNFLFPLLDMDLKNFFKQPKPHGDFRWNFTFFSALYGLASALSHVHNLRLEAATHRIDFEGIGYHHDLRPANILISKKTFILADFGLGKLKSDGEPSTTPWKVGTGDYLAPECRHEKFVPQDVGRAIDIWAFGCLMAELATFMKMGAEGLERFLHSRLSPGAGGYPTTYFYDQESNLKTSVKHWLHFLQADGPHAGLYKALYSLITKVLVGKTQERPTAVEITQLLAPLSLKAHFFAAHDSLTKILEADTQFMPDTSRMKLWFERERLRAFGNALVLAGAELKASLPGGMEKHYDKCIRIMLSLFHMLLKDDDPQRGSSGRQVQGSEDGKTLLRERSGAEVQSLVQALWDILPDAELRKAESIWVQSMLDTDDSERLDRIERALSSESQRVYQEGAAMVLMKKIRLEMIHNTMNTIETRELQPADVSNITHFCGHSIGTYLDGSTIMVEWMSYSPEWEKVSPLQRSLIMSYKVEGFNVNPKPQDLRLLECVGFFEMNGNRKGYGFVYRVPQPELGVRSPGSPTTLLQLLVHSAKHALKDKHFNQPLLGEKYRLAYKLAGFLKEFHTLGWLHENFHSNNIIFFNGLDDAPSISPARSEILQEPYVIGLHKSRPGSNSWNTEGPASDNDFLSYRHPGYARTKRFRFGYDYYSLGLMLLEIGLWYPLQGWCNKSDYRTLSPHAFRDVLVKEYVPRLGPRMGKVYQDAVMLCLADGLDRQPQAMQPTSQGENNVCNSFVDNVFEPLEALSMVHI